MSCRPAGCAASLALGLRAAASTGGRSREGSESRARCKPLSVHLCGALNRERSDEQDRGFQSLQEYVHVWWYVARQTRSGLVKLSTPWSCPWFLFPCGRRASRAPSSTRTTRLPFGTSPQGRTAFSFTRGRVSRVSVDMAAAGLATPQWPKCHVHYLYTLNPTNYVVLHLIHSSKCSNNPNTTSADATSANRTSADTRSL